MEVEKIDGNHPTGGVEIQKNQQTNFTQTLIENEKKFASDNKKVFYDNSTQTLIQDLIEIPSEVKDNSNNFQKLVEISKVNPLYTKYSDDKSGHPYNNEALYDDLLTSFDPLSPYVESKKPESPKNNFLFRKNSLYSEDLIILEETNDYEDIKEEEEEYDENKKKLINEETRYKELNNSDESIGVCQESSTPETRECVSSADSDVSISYDRQLSLETSQKVEEIRNRLQEKLEVNEETEENANDDNMSDSMSDYSIGKDSGCEFNLNDSDLRLLPNSELAQKIVEQVEFYFSNENITKDAFLLKHVKRNKEGYVSLKLISSFKRVKHLTKDWRVVADALLNSKNLEINEAGTKVRRIEPLPIYDETTPSRTVVAVYMPIEKPTIENVAEIFKECGEIALVRILRPGNPIPADVRQFMNKNPSMANLDCALVEFISSESARKALDLQNKHFEGYEPMKIYQLNNVPSERKKKISNATNKSRKNSINKVNYKDNINRRRDSDYSSCMSCASCSENEEYFSNQVPRQHNINDPRYRMRRGSAAYPVRPQPDIPAPGWIQRRLSAVSYSSGSESPYSAYSPRKLSASSRESSESNIIFYNRRYSNSSIVSSSGSSDYNFRRLSTVSNESYCSGPRSRSNSNNINFNHLPDNVVRMPQGPDGSKGFRQRFVNNTTY